MKSKRLKICVALILLGVLIYFGRQHFGKLSLLLEVDPIWVICIAGLYIVTRMINGEIMRITAAALGKKIKRSESFYLVMVMSYQNLIIPKSGLSAPAIYLKLKHGLKLSEFTSFLLPMTIIQLACFGIAGLLAQVYLLLHSQVPLQPAIALLFGVLFIGNSGFLFVRIQVPAKWQNKIGNILRKIIHAWEQLRINRVLIVKVIMWQTVIILLRTIRMQIAFWALGMPIAFPAALIVSLLAQLALFISLTPGALGFREAALVYGSYLLSVSADISLAVGILDRVVTTACILAIGLPALWFVFIKKNKKPRSC